ncbi:MFS transporter [Dictyobacter sp. S3.2.2.5]|uniref:MFS transporter n=1 Tax=Dictyobacter halimunensis TaxID=3026934 RepID=A0ABQ6FPB5_9CHLR|nr:MFS transporter [Dictyobacter sp. S3.2.2.5]
MSTSLNPEELAPASTPQIVKQAEETNTQNGELEMSARDGATQPDMTRPAGGGMTRLFKVRDFTLLFGGQTISTFGDALYMVALPWLILTTGGNVQELGIVLSAYGIPRAVCMLAGGWLSDRLRPRRLMLIADTLRLLLMGVLAALAFGGHPLLWQLCAIAVPLGAMGGAFTPASMSMVPDRLSKDDLQAGNGLMMASMQGANLIGSSVAGVIVAGLTSAVALTIDAVTFLVSAGSLALMRGAKHATPAASQESPLAGAQETGTQISFWGFLRTSRLIQIALFMFIVSSLVTGGLIEVALPALVQGPLHGSASAFGFILAGWGAGALIGSILAGMLGKFKHKGLIILLGGMIIAAMFALLPVGGVPGAVACMLIAAIASSGFSVLFFTAVQMNIPSHLMGRVMGLLMFSSLGLYPVSTALAGVLANHLGPAILFPFAGLVLAATMLFGMTQKVLREL